MNGSAGIVTLGSTSTKRKEKAFCATYLTSTLHMIKSMTHLRFR